MKKPICLFLFFVARIAIAHGTGTPKIHFRPVTPGATFDSIWVDYNIKESDVLGMKIHLKFTAYGMKNMDAYVAVYYTYNDEMAGVLKDKNGKMVSTAGDVALYKAIKPAYDPEVYYDLSLFMPYSELDQEPGEYDLTMDVKLIYKAGGLIEQLTYHDFEYTRPGSPADAESVIKADASFENMWVDYDVTESGKKGMRIHLKFSAINMKGVDAYAAVYFQKKNGEKIEGVSTAYRSKSGQLAVYKSLKPGYDEAVYKDLQLFMPYSEINTGTGKFNLKMKAEIIYPSGDLIKHLKDYDFLFTR
jgi:uncharacterized protein YxeA